MSAKPAHCPSCKQTEEPIDVFARLSFPLNLDNNLTVIAPEDFMAHTYDLSFECPVCGYVNDTADEFAVEGDER